MMPTPTMRRAVTGLALALEVVKVNAQTVYSIDTEEDILNTAATLAFDTLSYYKGNQTGQTPGILPGPPPDGDYYWWEGGALWGTMIDYWHWTGDSSYNHVVQEAMVHQVGDDWDYQPINHTASLGNDDQGFWGMSAMLAAESNFPNPPSDEPQWLALAQAVFNTQADPSRHDDYCGGGMRWQIPLSNNGYNYKNTIANGCFFNIGARLARYTGNDTYMEYAAETWDWLRAIKYIDDDYNVYDGAHVEDNCTLINRAQFSYNNGVLIQGVAFLYNYTNGDAFWKEQLDGLLDNTMRVFFANGVAYEVACETGLTCTTDMYSFKGYIHRWLSTVTQVAPYTAEIILPVLRNSTLAAINNCIGGESGRECGFSWLSGEFDGKVGAGQQMNVLAAVSGLLVDKATAPVTADSGGTSEGDPSAGSDSSGIMRTFRTLTTGDKAGAGILTFVILATATGTFGWMSWGA